MHLLFTYGKLLIMMKRHVYFTAFLISALLTITGCSTNEIARNSSINAYSLVTPPEHQRTTRNYLAQPPGMTSKSASSHPDAEIPGYSTRVFYSSDEAAPDDGCGAKDRFDTKGVLAYYSDDRTKRLSFHTGGFDEAVLRYSFKLRQGLDRKEKLRMNCLYNSRFQGIIGSVYNELYMRGEEEENGFEKARKKLELEGLDFWK